jgi:hypothetical protein
MGKVIDIWTRKEITEIPVSKEAGEFLILNLLQYELSRSTNPFAPDIELISNLISMVENNTGARRYEVMDRLYETRAL